MQDKEVVRSASRFTVFGRVSPQQKKLLIESLKNNGRTVAMTGDGVNDAPALKQSDVGVAMGITGTEVSKDAASMVLTDDNFATIVRAVSNGRSIYRNISNAVQFLLSGNTAGILAVLFASLAGLPAPFAPVHLLFINLVTDSLPAIAIGLEKPEEAVMSEPPRNINEPLLNKKFAQTVLFQGLLIGIATMIAFYIGLNADLMEAAVMGASANGAANGSSSMTAATMAFAVLCLARLIHGFNSRTQGPLSLRKLFSNKFSWIAFLSGSLLLAAVMLIRPLQNVFETVSLTMEQYLQIAGLALLPTIIIQIVRRLMARR
jgi:Ca2+-transporting ATPase